MSNPETKTYLVEVYRTSYAARTLEIEATSEDEAIEKAYGEAGNHEFSEHTSEYEVESARIKP